MKKHSIHTLFLISLGFTFILLAYRIYYSETFTYLFLIWNLFLAWIPLLLGILLSQTKKRWSRVIIVIVWLLFFPNSLYIVTDFMHLKERHPIPLWFDIILLFSAVLNGLMMAFVSLSKVENYVRSIFSASKSNAILFACLFLSSFGIYLGRFLRLNSWDVVASPSILVNEIVQRFFNPFEYIKTWNVTIILTLFFTIFYFTIKKIPARLSPGSNN